jgi:hypothetical protein
MVQNIKTEEEEDEMASEKGSLNIIVIAIEKRNGMCSLIARTTKSVPSLPGKSLIRVFLCPLFSRRLKIFPGTSLNLNRYTHFDI